MDMDKMTPRRPYLVRAFYEWLSDNELTPHLVVDATMVGVRVPLEFVEDGQIILNVAPRAVGNLEMSNEAITFSARFSGRPHSVIVPMYAVQAIYARENGAGTMFEPEDGYELEVEKAQAAEDQQLSSLSSVDPEPEVKPQTTPQAEANQDAAPTKSKGRPSLTIVK
ncbi:ClpXP protease specificity-enhancing factor [Vibrio sp. S11_S32]|uniref:ClpXP protease specificity-enhancing factor n=1 Tax=Vibrio sp. S11_S32 TaxID=2720225 RepID=UPI00168008C2|nr:ClpXP protease specificity-enhancing factor [Vibrio sp. S11_S32]MBD1577222.1 ClpXP protease specificity-enhancing factor [Vibrio sp. S11_S32]